MSKILAQLLILRVQCKNNEDPKTIQISYPIKYKGH
jgi:hypothetical protein